MRLVALLIALTISVPFAPGALAQTTNQSPTTQADQDGTVRLRLPVVNVTAQKELEDAQETPVSVTPVTRSTLDAAHVRSVSDAGDFAPNVFFSEFSARKLSNARFRGLGSSPANPGITTYIDGVPQLNTNSSSIELLEIDQVEFVRGPQSALFGRNSLGGVINVSSARPSLQGWTGTVSGPFGNFGTADVRGSVSGPVAGDRLAIGVAAGYSTRDGYTINDITGNDLDSRSASFTKTQALWAPASNWEIRALVTTERARDGDYALNDLGALRANPYHAARDFEGHTWRDIVAPTVALRRTGSVEFYSTTGFVWWETDDATDLDYTPLPLANRTNNEQDFQFTQEFRVASARNAGYSLTSGTTLGWQTGATVFTQSYDQEAINSYAPFVLSPFVGFPVTQLTPSAALDDVGFGFYGQATIAFGMRFDTQVGLRADFEQKEAFLETSYDPTIAPPTIVDDDESYSNVAPQFTVSYHVAPDRKVYGSVSGGYKAGGFNAASPQGMEKYNEESSWNYEGGFKTMWFDRRMAMNAAIFYTDWNDMQVNTPNPFVPGQFFISNAAGARSAGFELEMNARLAPGCDLFGGWGYTNAEFGEDSASGGVPVAGNRVSNTPSYTADFGGQYTVALNAATSVYGRADVAFKGGYYYDDANTEQQDAYSVSNFRVGVRHRRLWAEAWIRNAFAATYVPIAFPYRDGLAPSGFLGENGAPRTFGVRLGASF
jgi:iron complex outermembrane receptor protein